MIALALLCMLLALALVGGMLFAIVSGQHVGFSFFAGDFTTRPFWIFIAGAVALLLAEAALALFRRGTRRKVAQRREIRRLRKVEETSTVPAAHDSGRHAHDHPVRGGASSDETLVRETRTDPDDETRRP